MPMNKVIHYFSTFSYFCHAWNVYKFKVDFIYVMRQKVFKSVQKFVLSVCEYVLP